MKIRNYEIKRKCNDPTFLVWNLWKGKRMSDLISKQKMIKTIYYYFEDLIKALPKNVDSNTEKNINISKTEEYLEIYRAIRELILILPSEKARTGEWIFLDKCCSKCRKKLMKEGWSNTVKKINFCPKCGADIREPFTIPTEIIESVIGYDD